MNEKSDFDDDVDFYSFFNISKEATKEEIVNAYRRMSRLYHPDKHTDPEKKRQAERLFSKTRRIYDVLTNPHKRAIYDTLGLQALQTTGWELVERRFSPEEIREEYERLVRQREEQLLHEEAHPQGSVAITVNAVDLFQGFGEKDDSPEWERGAYIPEIVGMRISQSVEAPLTLNDRLIVGGTLASENGRGTGNLSLAWRRIINSRMWSEAEASLVDNPSIGLKMVRTFSARMYGSAQLVARFDGDGEILPAIGFSLTRQLDKHVSGTVNLLLGAHQTVTTTIAYDDAVANHASVSVAIGRPILFVLCSYTRRFTESDSKVKTSLRFGTDGFLTEMSYERRLSERNSVQCACRVHFPRGITLKFKFQRASQTYLANVQLSQDEVTVTPLLYGVVVPLVAYNVLKWCLLPVWERRQAKLVAEKNARDYARISAKKEEAESAIQLMHESYERIKTTEEQRRGLVIVEAWYGNLTTSGDASQECAHNVTIPLQILTKDSKLILPPGSKNHIPGFYDPCPNEGKHLVVVYKFRDIIHRTMVQDNETLAIPKSSHLHQTE